MTPTTLIILPGWGGSSATWSEFIQQAQTIFTQVVCVELPCFGKTPCPHEVWGVEEYATYVATEIANIREHSNNPIVLLGHSFGGQVATQLLATHPVLCDKLVLSGAAVYRRSRGVREIGFSLIAKSGKIIFSLPVIRRLHRVAQKFLYQMADSPDYLQTSGIQRLIFQKVIRQDVSHLLGHISIPTLVVWGTHDSYVPLRLGKKIANAIPHSTLVTIPKAGHGLHRSHQNQLLSLIRNFVEKNN